MLDPSKVGTSLTAVRDWTESDSLLYSLAAGAGQSDPLCDLAFTTENSKGITQQVLPTFGAVLTQFPAKERLDFGAYDPAMLVHAGMGLKLTGELPPSGSMTVVSTITGMYDKGRGALVVIGSTGTLSGHRAPTVITESSVFIRGSGGFGGDSAPATSWNEPNREPDVSIEASTRPDQALLYRLTGDRNPLHSDPEFARRAGFQRPILHGMCTYAVIGRTLLNAVCNGDSTRFRSLSGRFSSPVFPGDKLLITGWSDVTATRFRVYGPAGQLVMDHGMFQTVDSSEGQ